MPGGHFASAANLRLAHNTIIGAMHTHAKNSVVSSLSRQYSTFVRCIARSCDLLGAADALHFRLASAVMSSASGCRGPASPSSPASCLVHLLAEGFLALPDAAASALAKGFSTCCRLALCSLRVLGLCIGGRPAAASEADRSVMGVNRLPGPAEEPGGCVCRAVCSAGTALAPLCECLAGWVA